MAEEDSELRRTARIKPQSHSVLGGAIELLLQPQYLQVTFSRSSQNLSEFEAVRSAVDLTLRMARLKRVLFDVRKADRAPDDVRAKIWEWITVSGPFERVAFVTDNEMIMITINMTGVKSHKALRAFIDANHALSWLTK